jgi:SAM-dependent methyltransferase
VKSEEYARMFAAEERQWWYAGMREIAFALLRSAQFAPDVNARVLDAGCGTGNNLIHMRRFGRTIGIDLSEDAIAHCRARRVPAIRGSVLSLPIRNARVALATSFDVLYHVWVTSDRDAVAEMARVVKPGGFVLVRVPALRILWGAHDEAVLSRHRYTRGELTALLRSAGLEVVRASYANTLLFPLLLARRLLDRLLGRHGSDVSFLPAPLEWTFLRLLRVEAWLVGLGVSLPIGASVLALARKPGKQRRKAESGPQVLH